MFEDGKEIRYFYMGYKDSMQKALEARGFEFPFGLVDGEITPLEIVYSPKGMGDRSRMRSGSER